MNNKFGNFIKSVTLKSGLFGKKPSGVDIYENGIIVKLKNENKECLFENIDSIKTSDYFAPNPVEYHFEIINKSGEKVASLSIPYVQRTDATVLLETYKEFQLGSKFPQNILETIFVLDNCLTWENGKLIYKGRKGTEEYSPQQIDKFAIKDGSHFFTLKNSKDTLMVSLYDSPNCLTSIEVCKAIANIE